MHDFFYHTLQMRKNSTSSPTYEIRFFYPPQLSKIGQVNSEVVLKNHNKSQKIIK
jgi:hypothetical protein